MKPWILLLLLLAGCSMVAEAGEAAVEAAPASVGALLGFLFAGTPLAVLVGSVIGWLVSDDVKHRLEAGALKEDNYALQRTIDQETTAVERTIIGTLESLGAWAWPLAIGTVAVVLLLMWRSYRAGKKKALR